ncbi:imidazolonepropionase [Paraglaciecola sp. 2405UD69-4]|uniref:imidazolonepropionase n=1 Tax=Paraglaciecola sp. 2405UD69-4 TaxID=3391836 RepID=UPI0039C9D612
MPNDVNIINASSVALICDNGKPRSGNDQSELNIIHNGGVIIRNGDIVAVGTMPTLSAWLTDKIPVIDATGKTLLPGLIECHSHPIFDGNRHWEYVRRLEGASGQSIRAEGGGIWSTIVNTRKASDSLLITNTLSAFQSILAGGVTTLEVKSGYGLNTEQELRLLRLLDQAASHTPLDIVTTFLGAHIAPQDGRTVSEYVEEIKNKMVPAVINQGIAEFHDITCEIGDFEHEHATELLLQAKELGIPTRVHADASSNSKGWRTAVNNGAVAADHLTYTPDHEITDIGATNTIAVLLPAAEQFYLDNRKANAKLFIDTQVPVAIATDYCSSFQATSLTLTIAQACSWFGMTPAQAIVGATINAAYVLNRATDRGSLDIGKRGDITIFDCEHPNQLGTAIGAPIVNCVISKGQVIWASQS